MIDWIFSKYNKHVGLLLLRLGFGGMFAFAHGIGKITGGPEEWAKLGGVMKFLGMDFAPAFWGFMAAGSEFFGGILIMLGLLFRPAAGFLFCTMFVAASMHWGMGDSLGKASHAIENGIILISLLFIGPGKYSLDQLLLKKIGNDGDAEL